MGKEFIANNFFVIESTALECVQGRIYGYAIDNERIFINAKNHNEKLTKECYGCYVNVVVKDNYIEIIQDYFGSYGIYLFEDNDYFAISNSFLYLVNYLKNRKILTFDNDFAMAFQAAPQAVLSYQDTMIKEIKMLPRNAIVKIDVTGRKICVHYNDIKKEIIKLDTKEAIEIIDKWHRKWNKIFNTILNEKLPVSFGLSGGKDSRVSLACCMKPKLNLQEINFFSATDSLSTHSDDYKIAKQISEQYGFELNKKVQEERYKMDPVENLNTSFLVKCGFHREIMPSHFWYSKPIFRITGSGGDLRELWNEPAESFIDKMVRYTIFNSVDCRSALMKMMYKTKSQVDEVIKEERELTANDYFYKEARQRNHNGKANAEVFMSNVIVLSPLMDPILYKLDQNIDKDNDNDLLYAVIYERYLPEISEVGFDSKRIIKKETIQVAREINSKFREEVYSEIGKHGEQMQVLYDRISPDRTEDKQTAHDYLKKLFYSESVKKFSYSVFGEEMYKRADKYYQTRDYHPYIAAMGLVESFIIYNAAQKSHEIDDYSGINEITSIVEKRFVPVNYTNNGFMKECIDYLQSARFDIKNWGIDNNKINFLESSDNEIFVSTPEWFKNEKGEGKVFQSCKGNIELKFEIIGDGELTIKVMGPWLKDDSNMPASIKIDFVKFVVKDFKTDEILFSKRNQFTVDCTNTQIVKLQSKDKQKILIEAEWLPYIYTESEIVDLVKVMYYKGIDDYKFWKKAENN